MAVLHPDAWITIPGEDTFDHSPGKSLPAVIPAVIFGPRRVSSVLLVIGMTRTNQK